MQRTILFTDLEGSTQLWENHPDAMHEALQAHDDAIVEILERRDSDWWKGTGDGFAAAFVDSVPAVQAAVDIQRRLNSSTFGQVGRLRARIGLHSGPVTARDNDLFGPTMNRAARIMSAAHGGQIVASRGVTESVDSDGFTIRDLGSHRLKDLLDPAQIFQISVDGLEDTFPRLRSLPALTNLPVDRSTFRGREEALRSVVELLDRHRLVTLVGTGGVGKTRLATHALAEIADRFPDGAWFIPLAAVTDPNAVAAEMARVLGLLPEQYASAQDALASHVRGRRLALLVDNCEHVIDEVAVLIEQLLGAGPGLRVLATSREGLAIGEEATHRVTPLVPEDAARLFADRAGEAGSPVEPSDPAVARICSRLDGLALAIELAASKVPALGLTDLEARLEDRFSVLRRARGGARHHRTLAATIQWSYELAEPAEQLTLARLSAFSGLFSLETASRVAGFEPLERLGVVEAIERLVDRSLVSVVATDDPERFHLLESIKEFAAGRLAAEPNPDYPALRLIEVMGALAGETPVPGTDDESEWLAAMHRNAPNLRAALAAAERLGNHEDLRELVDGSAGYWIASGSSAEAVRWAELAAATGELAPKETLADLYLAGDRDEEADEIYREVLSTVPEDDVVVRARIIRKMVSRSTMVMTVLRSRSGAQQLTEALELLGPPQDDWPEPRIREWINLQLDIAGIGYFGFDADRQRTAIEAVRPWLHRATPRQTVEFEIVERGLLYQVTRYRPPPDMRVSEAEFRGVGPANQEAYSSALFRTAFYELLIGEVESAHANLTRSAEIAARLGSDLRLARVYAYLSIASRRIGDVPACREHSLRSLHHAEAVSHHSYRAAATANLGWCDLRDGMVEAAEAKLSDAAERFAERARRYPFRWLALLPLLEIHSEAADLDNVRSVSAELLDEDLQQLPADLEAALQAASRAEEPAIAARSLDLARRHRLL